MRPPDTNLVGSTCQEIAARAHRGEHPLHGDRTRQGRAPFIPGALPVWKTSRQSIGCSEPLFGGIPFAVAKGVDRLLEDQAGQRFAAVVRHFVRWSAMKDVAYLQQQVQEIRRGELALGDSVLACVIANVIEQFRQQRETSPSGAQAKIEVAFLSSRNPDAKTADSLHQLAFQQRAWRGEPLTAEVNKRIATIRRRDWRLLGRSDLPSPKMFPKQRETSMSCS